MITRKFAAVLLVLSSWSCCVSTVAAQASRESFDSLDALKAYYAKQDLELDRRRIADMSALAAKQTGDAAETTYRELFQLAIARDLFAEAEPASLAYAKTPGGEPRDRAIATYVGVIAKANRGDYDQSLADLKTFSEQNALDADSAKRVDPGMVIAIGEAYLQRVFRGGRYDIAKKTCELIIARRPEPEIRAHFRERLARIEMLGKPAPAIRGRDIDDREISLANYRGKVVLVDFWATWCPPCVAAIPDLQALQAKYGKDGFVILGVNLDARREDVGSLAKAKPVVRKFLLDAGISWASILVGPPAAEGDPTAAFGVEDIPASFLIGKDGTIIGIEQVGPDLDKAVAKALKP